MRVAIIHNTNAGEGEHSTEELAERLLRTCSEVEVCGTKREDMEKVLRTSPELIVVAGGDGTVAKTIRNLFELRPEPRVPLLVLPVGTANNLARSLGMDDDPKSLLRAIDDLESVQLDVGRIEGSWGSALFVESIGIGALGTILEGERSAAIRLARAVMEAVRPKDRRFEKRVEDFAHEVERAEPRLLRVVADGEDLSGEYIVAEVMNIRTIGPLIPFAPDADPGDGMLNLLLVTESDRDALAAHVLRDGGAPGDGAPQPPGIKRRVREVVLSWPETGGHVDDRAWPEKEEWTEGSVRVTVAGAIEARRPR